MFEIKQALQCHSSTVEESTVPAVFVSKLHSEQQQHQYYRYAKHRETRNVGQKTPRRMSRTSILYNNPCVFHPVHTGRLVVLLPPRLLCYLTQPLSLYRR